MVHCLPWTVPSHPLRHKPRVHHQVPGLYCRVEHTMQHTIQPMQRPQCPFVPMIPMILLKFKMIAMCGLLLLLERQLCATHANHTNSSSSSSSSRHAYFQETHKIKKKKAGLNKGLNHDNHHGSNTQGQVLQRNNLS